MVGTGRMDAFPTLTVGETGHGIGNGKYSVTDAVPQLTKPLRKMQAHSFPPGA